MLQENETMANDTKRSGMSISNNTISFELLVFVVLFSFLLGIVCNHGCWEQKGWCRSWWFGWDTIVNPLTNTYKHCQVINDDAVGILDDVAIGVVLEQGTNVVWFFNVPRFDSNNNNADSGWLFPLPMSFIFSEAIIVIINNVVVVVVRIVGCCCSCFCLKCCYSQRIDDDKIHLPSFKDNK
jgi:hypothetical protein